MSSCVGLCFRKRKETPHSWSSFFAIFKDNRFNNLDGDSKQNGEIARTTAKKKAKKRDKLRAAGRTFILGIADTQTIFIGAFLLSFAGSTKCSLTSYHFTVSVDQMLIALSAFVLSVALVRSYWRNPFAALLRLSLETASFIGVGLTLFRQLDFAPDYPPPKGRKDSAILLPVACLLESGLRKRSEEVANQANATIGFGSISTWPLERRLFIPLAAAFIAAHVSVLVRYVEGKIAKEDEALQKPSDDSSWYEIQYLWIRRQWLKVLNVCVASLRRHGVLTYWSDSRISITVMYWVLVVAFPLGTSIWVWVRVFQARNWVRESGWIAEPNPEFNFWDAGQLTALGTIITVIMNVLSELWKRDDKETRQKKREDDRIALLNNGQQLQSSIPRTSEDDDRLQLHLAGQEVGLGSVEQRRHPYVRVASHLSPEWPPHRDLGQSHQY